MTRSGLPASSNSGRTPVRALAATNFAFSIRLRRALRSASAIASGTISRPQTSPVCAASESPIVPIPQKRSKTRSRPESDASSAATA